MPDILPTPSLSTQPQFSTKRYHHLTYDQRCQIYALKQSGKSGRLIALQLGISQSTVCRELLRNVGARGYRYKQAHVKASTRRSIASRVVRVMTAERIAHITHLLSDYQWSPEQIAAMIRKSDGINLCHESIYRHVWRDKRLGGTLYVNLRQRGKKRNKRGSANAGRGLIPNRRDISERPVIVDEKSRLGDWELDSIIGAKHRGSIVSMVERTSKLVRLELLERPTAQATQAAIVKRLQPIASYVHTLTSDNGKEFARHQDVAKACEADFYFARPYHAWERGLNENTNGLVRQYFPKGLDFTTICKEDVQRVENLLNTRPRKTLNYLTPNQAFAQSTNITSDALRM